MTTAGVHPKLRLATVGLGNWAGRVLDLLLKQHDASDAGFELTAVCEPNLAAHSERVSALQARGIPTFDRYDHLLQLCSVEAIVLPVPIHLHRAMTEQALMAGKAVLVEKPAAGCVQDVDAMIAARDRANLPVLVSFQDTYDPALVALKRVVLGGEIGEIRSATLVGCWPRDEAYYARTTWAGKIRHHDTWVLDSPLSNAFAHYLHLALFLLGKDEQTWADPQSVEAELYRAYPIENYDTASLRIVASGVPFLTLLTHACQESIGPHISLTGERGAIEIDLISRSAQIRSVQNLRTMPLHPEPRELVFPAFARHVRGLGMEAVVSTLDAARMHVIATNGASQAAAVQTLGSNVYAVQSSEGAGSARFIPGIEQLFLRCAARGQMIHESGEVDWSVPAGAMSLEGYPQFVACPERSLFVQEIANLLRPRAATVHAQAKPSLTRDTA
jgi:predicted dehydrogenase